MRYALVTDAEGIDRIARLDDDVSLTVPRNDLVRHELLSWMRLTPGHPRCGFDGVSREALRMSPVTALGARLMLGSFWTLADWLGLTSGLTPDPTPGLTAEAGPTRTAVALAAFHRPAGKTPVSSGRAYLRLWLEATARGTAGWPMAALSADPSTRAALSADPGLAPDRRPIQVIRFGTPTAPMPPRARRPLAEVLG